MSELKKENDENYLSLCRICGKYSNCTLDLFKSEQNGKKLVEMLSFCLNQAIPEDDGLPRIICLSCESNLNVVHEFHRRFSDDKPVKLPDNKNEVCQVCGKYSNCILDLFKSEHNDKKLVEMLSFCLSRMIHEEDGSGIICLVCESNLIAAYKFHTLCKVSKRLFQEMIAKRVQQVAKVNVEIVNKPASESEIKIENETLVCVEVSDFNNDIDSETSSKQCNKENTRDSNLELAVKTKTPKVIRAQIFKKHLATRKLICHYCPKEFTTKRKLSSHIRGTHEIKYLICGFENCNSKHKSKPALRFHMLKHTGGEKSFTCNFCQKQFWRQSDLLRHENIHTGEKPCVCNVCQKAFSDTSRLSRHRKIHSGVKPYVCKFCQKAFVARPGLIKHERIHTGEKPFVCKVCQKAFTNWSGIATHSRTHTGEKPYSCKICQLSFAQSSHLKQHSRVHTGEKPYVCEVCQFRFAQIGHLLTHQKIHARENSYSCKVCHLTFSLKSKLSIHERIHSGELQFSCAHCGKSYIQKRTLRSHLSKCFKQNGFEHHVGDLNQVGDAC